MRKAGFTVLLFLAFSIQLFAQWIDIPVGIGSIPQAKLKGAVHTVLTVEQSENDVLSTIVEIFDRKGRRIEQLYHKAAVEIHSGKMGALSYKSTFSYDSSNRLVKAKHFTPQGKYFGYESFIYDSKNNLIEEVRFDVNNKESRKFTYTYSPQNREVEVNGEGSKILLVYNEKYQWTKRTYVNTSNFEYDDTGNVVKELNGNYAYIFSYLSDEQGNWTERETIAKRFDKTGKEEWNHSQYRNTYRTFTYYSDDKCK